MDNFFPCPQFLMTQGTRKINACMTEQHKQKDTLQTLAEKTETEDG